MAKAKRTAANQIGTELDAISQRAKSRTLERTDLETIREKIAEIEALDLEALDIKSRLTRTAQRNLKIADTQLRDILQRIEDGRIDEAAFAELPDYLKEQILTRLDNNIDRMRQALAATQGKDADYSDPAFKCIADFEKCKANAKGSTIWCHIAMTVCLMRTLAPLVIAPGNKKAAKK